MDKTAASSRVLEPTLKAILDVISPKQEDWAVRYKIIEDLKDVVRSVQSLRGATVEPFGSFISNLFARWGDLDISVTLSNGSCLSSAGKRLKQNLLDDLLRALRQKGGWRRLQCIRNARVPILKFESGHQRISCDVSIDNLEGQMKSTFLFWVNMIDGRFHDMVLLVKEWAKAHKINDSKAGTLNSYSLSLLVIFHFQTCIPAILPPLKDIYPRSVVDDLKGVRIDAERNIKEICSANIARYKSNKSRAINRSSLSELFISFLAKFSDISVKAKQLGICTFSGQWESINSNTRWLPKTYALFIEDPFEQPENSARAVSAANLGKISEAFHNTYYSLLYANQIQTSLLDMLVRPQVSQVIAGTSVGNSTNTSGHNLTIRQEVSRTLYASGPSLAIHQESTTIRLEPQLHHQIQKTKSENHSRYQTPRSKENDNLGTKRKGSRPNNLTNQRHETFVNNLTKQRQESQSNNLPKQRQESQPNCLSTQKQESKPNLSKQKQVSNPYNLKKQSPAQPYRNQSQQIWRPKSEG